MEPKEDTEICEDDAGKFEETAVYDYSSGDSCGFTPCLPSAIKTEVDDSNPKSSIDFSSSFTSSGFSPSQPVSTKLEFESAFNPSSTSSPVIKSCQVIEITSGSSDSEETRNVEMPPVENAIVLSSDDDLKEQEQSFSHEIEMHNGKIPIYKKSSDSLTSKEILQLCFGEVSDEYICKQKPVSVRYNAVFVVDLHSVDLRSLYADDNGVWQTSSPKSYFRVLLQDGKVESVETANKTNYTHCLKRQYGKHQATYIERGVTFQRIISTVYSNTRKFRYGVVQYIHRDGIEEDIVMNPHGNAKKLKRPFYKTDPEVFEEIKKEGQHTKPKRLFKNLMDKAGGSLTSTSAASEPRNVKQIYNARSSQKPKPDEFAHLVSQIKEDSFVRELTIDSDFVQYILTTDKQLVDLKEFCTNPVKFSVFSIDSTFDVGNYYVTNTCYENLRVVHASDRYRGRYPLEMGPTFVHTQRNTNNFVAFFSALQRMDSDLKHIQAIGTDGDEALMNAVTICFQDSQKLLCSDHKKGNLEAKLKNLRATECATKHILCDVFGKNVGSLYEKGLIDAETSLQFDRKLRDFKPTWDCLVPGFHSWFVRYEADLFKLYLIKEVTDLAHVYGHFSNNRIESQNDNAKDWIGRTGNTSFPKLNTKMKEFIEAQQQDIEMAVFSSGSYELSDSYRSFRQERHIWNGLSAEQRNSVLKKFWNSKIGETRTRTEKGKVNTCINQSNIDENTESTGLKSQKLGTPFTSINLTGISEEFLKEAWEKAETLLSTEGSIVKAPGYNGLLIQHSPNTTAATPHMVTSTSTGKVSCNDCPVYQSMKICCHSLCAAQTMGIMDQFLNWRRQQKSEVNLNSLIMTGIHSGHKQKVSKPRKGGRAPLEKKTTKQIERPPLIEESSIQGALQMLDRMDENHPFELIYLFQTKASLCYGCRTKFNRENEQIDLIIRHYCEREYTVQGQKKTSWQFAYFHLRSSCVCKKFSHFKKEILKVSDESKDILPPEIEQKLTGMGININK